MHVISPEQKTTRSHFTLKQEAYGEKDELSALINHPQAIWNEVKRKTACSINWRATQVLMADYGTVLLVTVFSQMTACHHWLKTV